MDISSNSSQQRTGDGFQVEEDAQREVRLRRLMLAKQVEADREKMHNKNTGVDAVNKAYAKDAVMMDSATDYVSPAHLSEGDEEYDRGESGKNLGAFTQAMRARVDKEYARDDSEEVPDSQPKVGSDLIIEDARKDLLGAPGEEVGSGKDVVIDEQRRRTTRNVSDKNTMDKAKDRAKLKNLEAPESKRPASSNVRGAAAF